MEGSEKVKYVILNIETNRFVAPPGSRRSYTDRLQDAWVLDSKDEAERQCCGNERCVER